MGGWNQKREASPLITLSHNNLVTLLFSSLNNQYAKRIQIYSIVLCDQDYTGIQIVKSTSRTPRSSGRPPELLLHEDPFP